MLTAFDAEFRMRSNTNVNRIAKIPMIAKTTSISIMPKPNLRSLRSSRIRAGNVCSLECEAIFVFIVWAELH